MTTITRESLDRLRALLEAKGGPAYAPLLVLATEDCPANEGRLGEFCATCDCYVGERQTAHKRTRYDYWEAAPRGALAGSLKGAFPPDVLDTIWPHYTVLHHIVDSDWDKGNPDQMAVDAVIAWLEEKP